MRLFLNIKPYTKLIPVSHNDNVGNVIRNEVNNFNHNIIKGTIYKMDGNIKYNSQIINYDKKHEGYVTFFNANYHKRGKYHKNNHVLEMNFYTFSISLLKTLGLSIKQNKNNFTIYKIK